MSAKCQPSESNPDRCRGRHTELLLAERHFTHGEGEVAGKIGQNTLQRCCGRIEHADVVYVESKVWDMEMEVSPRRVPHISLL